MKPKLGDTILALRIIAAVIVLWLINWDELEQIIRSLSPGCVALAVSLEFSAFLIWALKWKFLVAKLEKVTFTTIFLGLMAGNFFSTNEIRARTLGGFGRARFLQRVTHNRAFAECYATIAVDQTGNNFIFSLLVIFSMLNVFLFLNIPWWLSIIMEVVALIIFLLALAAFISRRKINETAVVRFLRPKLQRIYDFSIFKFIRDRFDTYIKFEDTIVSSIAKFAKTYKEILKDRGVLTRDIGLSVVMYALIYAKDGVLIRGAGYDISIPHLIVALSIIFWVNSVVPVPKGLGFKELVMTGVYTMVGVPITVAVIVALMHRVIYLFFVVVVAYLAVVLLRISNRGSNRCSD